MVSEVGSAIRVASQDVLWAPYWLIVKQIDYSLSSTIQFWSLGAALASRQNPLNAVSPPWPPKVSTYLTDSVGHKYIFDPCTALWCMALGLTLYWFWAKFPSPQRQKRNMVEEGATVALTFHIMNRVWTVWSLLQHMILSRMLCISSPIRQRLCCTCCNYLELIKSKFNLNTFL